MILKKPLSFRFTSKSRQRDCSDSISKLFSDRNWNELNKVFSSKKFSKKKLNFMGSSDKCFEKTNLLHFACQFSPPLFVIEKLVRACSSHVYQVDHLGRFPLHVAVDYGASDKVIEYLMERNRDAAMALDVEGRTPLHLLFHNHHRNIDDYAYFQLSAVRKATHFVAWLLCQAAPTSVMMKDTYGITALDYAIDGHASDEIVRMLKKVSETEKKKMEVRLRRNRAPARVA